MWLSSSNIIYTSLIYTSQTLLKHLLTEKFEIEIGFYTTNFRISTLTSQKWCHFANIAQFKGVNVHLPAYSLLYCILFKIFCWKQNATDKKRKDFCWWVSDTLILIHMMINQKFKREQGLELQEYCETAI